MKGMVTLETVETKEQMFNRILSGFQSIGGDGNHIVFAHLGVIHSVLHSLGCYAHHIGNTGIATLKMAPDGSIRKVYEICSSTVKEKNICNSC